MNMDSMLASFGDSSAGMTPAGGHVPHVVAWNLTRRCNLECAHCYISAGPDAPIAGELTTAECLRITDEILAVNPNPMFILSGGEPLLRTDLTSIASHATRGGATVVVGTNGTLLDDTRIDALIGAGVSGVAVSVDSLRSRYHDRFRRRHGSLAATLTAIERLTEHGLDFVIQTTLTRGNRDELERLVAWSEKAGAVSFNAYLMVTTGRAEDMRAFTSGEAEDVLGELVELHRTYLGRMMVRAKCAPQFMRLVHERAPNSPVLSYATRCPCGVHYCRIAPDGQLTACPYLPLPAGDLRRASFGEIWTSSALFTELRTGTVGGKCGRCRYRAMCGGCRARAFAAEGDPMGPDPACAYEPQGVEPLVERETPYRYGDAEPEPCETALPWTEEARERTARIPSFVRGVVIRRVEDYARRRGLSEVSAEVLREVRREVPGEFSKRIPRFARKP